MSERVDPTGDPELVRRTLAGETAAFAQIVERHQRLVFGVALSSARDTAIAEDVAQEAFVEGWRELRRLRDPGSVGTWIAGIARNLARSWSRKAKRRGRHAEAIATNVELTADAATPFDAALERESRALLGQALDGIPAAYREVLVLFYVQGRSVAEVAQGLGISDDLVKQRMLRGRRALRDSLERGLEDALGKAGPSTAFTSIVMVAVSSATATKATAATTAGTAGKLLTLMSVNKVILGVAAVVLASGAAWYGLSRGDGAAPEPKAAPALVASAAVPAPPARLEPRTPGARRFADAADRARLIEAIAVARQQRRARSAAQPPSGPGQSAEAPASGDLDKDYIRSSVRELLPFIQECYEAALETAADKSKLNGNVVVKFTIEGEPETGGLVTESVIDETSEIKDPGFHECMRETMFALEIDPPTGGGQVKVTYPFRFVQAE